MPIRNIINQNHFCSKSLDARAIVFVYKMVNYSAADRVGTGRGSGQAGYPNKQPKALKEGAVFGLRGSI